MSREYKKRKRAESEEQTRLRITEAAVDLHGSVGPARTTISAIADRAGVQRATVYRHFPDEASLFEACSSHWSAGHPLPDPTPWAEIADPERRLRQGLTELYAWYENAEPMLDKIFRDAPLVPPVQRQWEASAQYFDAVTAILLAGRPRRKGVRAAIGHALAFPTWRSLVRDHGLSRGAAVDLMVRMADAA
jgi:AcrR family transcriptional regulator